MGVKSKYPQNFIAYVGPFSFPDGGAAARRILGNACSIQHSGYKVIIGSGQMPDEKKAKAVFFHEGIEVHSIGERTAEYLPRGIKNIAYVNMGNRTVRWLEEMPNKPAIVILYSGYSPYLMRLLRWCTKHDIPLVFDAVEWYQARSWIKGLFSPYHWNIELAMRSLVKKAGHVISISSYLHNYYTSNNCSSVIVPPTLDTKEITPHTNFKDKRKLVLAYTGTPGRKKDLLNNCLEAVLTLNSFGTRLIFKVAGIECNDILKYPALKKRKLVTLPSFIEAAGMVSHQEAIKLVGGADFTVLLRKPRRVSNAGFPTKVVESLAVGTPIICNYTSDLSKYITDNVEGIVCTDHSVESLIIALQRATELNLEKRRSMRVHARKRAEISFDYRQYSNILGEFFKYIINNKV